MWTAKSRHVPGVWERCICKGRLMEMCTYIYTHLDEKMMLGLELNNQCCFMSSTIDLGRRPQPWHPASPNTAGLGVHIGRHCR